MFNIKKYIANMSLKQKIFSIIFINLLFFSVAAFAGVHILTKTYNQTLYSLSANIVAYSARDIAREIETIRQISLLMVADSSIQQYLSIIKDRTEYPGVRVSESQGLYTLTNIYHNQFRDSFINFIIIHSDRFSTSSYLKNELPENVRNHIINQAQKANGAPVWVSDYIDEHGLILGRSIRRVENLKLDDLGVLIFSIDLKGLMQTTVNTEFRESFSLLYDNGNLVFDTASFDKKFTNGILQNLNSHYAIFNIGDEKYFAVKGRIRNLNWDYVGLVSYEEMRRSLMLSLLIYSGIIFICILVSIIISSFLLNSIHKHFRNLDLKIKGFASVKTPLPDVGYDYTGRKDELGMLHNQFDNMAAQIHNLININYKSNLLMKEAQLRALETQINPHFLYNTLESINWRAKAAGHDEISSMTKALGDLLRAMLTDFKEDFTLEQELALIHSYITIQQMRFSSQLCYTEDIDERLLSIYIPKLTIQPLIENSIHYGVEENIDTCYITLIIKAYEDDLCILVKNTGSYFEEDLLFKLKHKQIMPRRNGIGLLNIHKRLKLTFGQDYGLKLYNEESSAVACATIPLKKKEKKEV